MAELTLNDAVGTPPASNNTDDVRTVQTLLGHVSPPLTTAVSVTGTIDDATIRAIREFQRRFMSNPDGRVDPDGRTLWHLNDGFASQYITCSPTQRRIIDRDIINAQKWLDEINRRIGATLNDDAKRKISNIFHINVDDSSQATRLLLLRTRFRRLRDSLDETFPLQCEPVASLFAAWVDRNDPTGTMHFPTGHFQQSSDQRVETIIHERAHTVFNISHDGMSGAGELNFAQAPDDDNGFTHDQAMGNAYCYGWLSTSLQPQYIAPALDNVIVVPRPHR